MDDKYANGELYKLPFYRNVNCSVLQHLHHSHPNDHPRRNVDDPPIDPVDLLGPGQVKHRLGLEDSDTLEFYHENTRGLR